MKRILKRKLKEDPILKSNNKLHTFQFNNSAAAIMSTVTNISVPNISKEVEVQWLNFINRQLREGGQKSEKSSLLSILVEFYGTWKGLILSIIYYSLFNFSKNFTAVDVAELIH